jgi:1-phosphofructokinase
MIVTLTPNPSVDRTLFLDGLTVGSVNRSQRSYSEPSGKGVNVALALHHHGVAVRAVFPAGGPAGAQLRQMLDTVGLDTIAVPISGHVRSNISLTQPDGTVTKINEPGPVLTTDERERLIAATAAQLTSVAWLVCAGSLPAGLPVGWYGQLVELGRRHQVPVAIDSSGPPLAASLAAQPDLVKPNLHELAELAGSMPHTLGEVIDAAQAVRARGAGAVLASLGGDGAVLVDAHGALHGTAPVRKVVSTVGAGDAMLAGYLSCRADRREALATALQWGATAVQHEGTLFTHAASATVTATVTATVDRTRRISDHDAAATTAPSGPADPLPARA